MSEARPDPLFRLSSDFLEAHRVLPVVHLLAARQRLALWMREIPVNGTGQTRPKMLSEELLLSRGHNLRRALRH